MYLCAEVFSWEEQSIDFGYRKSMPYISERLFYIITKQYLSSRTLASIRLP